MAPTALLPESILLVGLDPAQRQGPPERQPESSTDAVPQLRAETARLGSGHASDFFEA